MSLKGQDPPSEVAEETKVELNGLGSAVLENELNASVAPDPGRLRFNLFARLQPTCFPIMSVADR